MVYAVKKSTRLACLGVVRRAIIGGILWALPESRFRTPTATDWRPRQEFLVKKKTQQEAPPVIEIDLQRCKGCGICVEFCPHDVLAIENGVAVLVNIEACNRCQFCDHRCPDFAITVK